MHLLQFFAQPTPPTVEGDPDTGHRNLQRVTYFLVGQTLDFTQDDNTAAGFGQNLEGSEDPATQLRGVCLPLRSRGWLEEPASGIGVNGDLRSTFAAAYGVDAGISGDPDKPRPDLFGQDFLPAAPQSNQHLLGHVLCLLPVGEQIHRQRVDLSSMGCHSGFEVLSPHPHRKTDPPAEKLHISVATVAEYFRIALWNLGPAEYAFSNEGEKMITVSFKQTAVSGLVLCSLIACGAAPPVDHLVDTTKIPITTCSEEARDAFLKGRWLFENLRITDAHEYFLKATEADPDFALGHLGVANTSPTNQEFFDAYRRAVDTSANASEGERFLIAALEANVAGEPEVQQAKLEALVALFPEDERAHNAIGNFLFFNQQDYERAISSYREAIAINPKFAPPYNLLGYALRQVGDYAGAEKAFQTYTELIPDQPNPYDSYGELLMKMGRYDESIASYEKALDIDPNFVASYVGIGTNRMFMGQLEDARSTFSRVEENARSNGERRQARFWTAASYLHEGDFENAFAETQKLYDIAAETDDRGTMAGDLNLMGDIFLRAGRADEAAEKYHAQIEMMHSSDVTDEIKEATVRNQMYDLARVALWKADLEAASGLANSYREDVAVHNVRFEVQRTHELDGMIALAEGDLDAAIGHFEKANQQDPQIWLLKARTYAAMGDTESARRACEEVINFNQLSFNLAFVRNTARELLETL